MKMKMKFWKSLALMLRYCVRGEKQARERVRITYEKYIYNLRKRRESRIAWRHQEKSIKRIPAGSSGFECVYVNEKCFRFCFFAPTYWASAAQRQIHAHTQTYTNINRRTDAHTSNIQDKLSWQWNGSQPSIKGYHYNTIILHLYTYTPTLALIHTYTHTQMRLYFISFNNSYKLRHYLKSNKEKYGRHRQA